MFIGEGKFESLLSKINQDILLEKRRGDYITPTVVDQLEKYKEGKYFISFSPYMEGGGTKLGINPKNRFNTPTGIYSYPIWPLWDTIYRKTLPYAADRPNIFVFKPKNESRIAFASTYNEEQMREDYRKLLRFSLGIEESEIEDYQIDYRYKKFNSEMPPSSGLHPLFFIWNKSRELVDRNVHKWAALLYKLYDGIVDDLGVGIIHSNEPTQAIFFNSKSIKVVDLIRNNNWGGEISLIIRSEDELRRFIDRGVPRFQGTIRLKGNNSIKVVGKEFKVSDLVVSKSKIGILAPSTVGLTIEDGSIINTLDLQNVKARLTIKGDVKINKIINVDNISRLAIFDSNIKPFELNQGAFLGLYNWVGEIDDIPDNIDLAAGKKTISNLSNNMGLSKDEVIALLKQNRYTFSIL